MTIQDLKDRGLIIFECITGSNAYGTNLPTSDVDIKGVFIQPLEDILGFGYVEQVNDAKCDVTYYELRRFLELISTSNPNLLEILNVPEDCVKFKHPIFDEVLKNADKFITKGARNSFAGYAVAQIKKARGLNKKIVNPVDKEKKSPLDFCYVITGYSSTPLVNYLEDMKLEQKFCGVTAVTNARDTYALFYDHAAVKLFSENGNKEEQAIMKQARKDSGLPMGYGFKGILLEGEDGFSSNEIRLSSIPKGVNSIATFNYNKDGYTKYCKDYTEYWNWVDNRNETRYNDNANHGKGYDGKNLMHCKRLLAMSLEIAQGKGINVRRPDREYLLSIRRGEYDYDTLIAESEAMVKDIDAAFENSNLPEGTDRKFTNDLLISMRKSFYNLQ
jgi:predicted nucleotidyltransferase